MLLVKAAKCFLFGLGTMPIACGALGTGLIFSASNIALARNPEMSDSLFTNSLIGFALIETFVVIGVGTAIAGYLLL